MTVRSRLGRLASIRNIAWRRVAAGILVPLLAVLVLQVRDYAASHNLTSADALREGMKEKSAEFKKTGEIYVKQ